MDIILIIAAVTLAIYLLARLTGGRRPGEWER
jgi:hypothetical protein